MYTAAKDVANNIQLGPDESAIGSHPRTIYNSPLPLNKRASISTHLEALIDLPDIRHHPSTNRSAHSTGNSVAGQQQQTLIRADHVQSMIVDNCGQFLPAVSSHTQTHI